MCVGDSVLGAVCVLAFTLEVHQRQLLITPFNRAPCLLLLLLPLELHLLLLPLELHLLLLPLELHLLLLPLELHLLLLR
jgi:hypothetical protein